MWSYSTSFYNKLNKSLIQRYPGHLSLILINVIIALINEFFTEALMYCTNCGKQQPDGSKFCNNCGTHLQTITPPTPGQNNRKPAQQPTQPPVQQPVVTPIQNQQSHPPVNSAPTPVSITPNPSQRQSGITCPRCHSTNVNVQVINQVHLKNVHHGCAWWLFVGWWWLPVKWIFFTVPALIIKLLKPKKQKIVNHVHNVAVCQSCGHSWRL